VRPSIVPSAAEDELENYGPFPNIKTGPPGPWTLDEHLKYCEALKKNGLCFPVIQK